MTNTTRQLFEKAMASAKVTYKNQQSTLHHAIAHREHCQNALALANRDETQAATQCQKAYDRMKELEADFLQLGGLST